MDSRAAKHSTGSGSWYTPDEYMDAVHEVLGGIALDPASDAEANQYVKAVRYFTEQDNGILRDWITDGGVYCNPPGKEDPKNFPSKEIAREVNQYRGQELWLEKMIQEYERGHFKEGIMLMFNASPVDTLWWHTAVRKFVVCIKLSRIKFNPPEGAYEDTSKNQPTHGNGWIYFGENREKFIEVFKKFGTIILPETVIYEGPADLIADKRNKPRRVAKPRRANPAKSGNSGSASSNPASDSSLSNHNYDAIGHGITTANLYLGVSNIHYDPITNCDVVTLIPNSHYDSADTANAYRGNSSS